MTGVEKHTERDRLEQLERLNDAATLRRIDEIGVGSGWRCLEIGAGAGSVATALAERSDENGLVVATDRDPRFLNNFRSLLTDGALMDGFVGRKVFGELRQAGLDAGVADSHGSHCCRGQRARPIPHSLAGESTLEASHRWCHHGGKLQPHARHVQGPDLRLHRQRLDRHARAVTRVDPSLAQ